MGITGVDYLMDLNRLRSTEFIRSRSTRLEWRRQREVEIGWIGCMDGRPHPAILTGTPLGLWPLWQNAKFDLENWLNFQDSVLGLRRCAKRTNRKLMYVITDHFSRSDDGRLGCRAHNYDTKKARAASRLLKGQFERFFGSDPDVYIVHATIDTDSGGMLFHGKDDVLDVAESVETNISKRIASLDSRMPEWAASHISEIAVRNFAHVAAIEKRGFPATESEHGEWVIAVGRGVDCWLHQKNLALTICPFGPDFSKVVRTAGKILGSNVQRRGFDYKRGAVLVAAASFREEDGAVGRAFAGNKALKLLDVGVKALEGIAGLTPHLRSLAVMINMADQRAEFVEA